MGGLTGYLFPQPIRESVFSTDQGLSKISIKSSIAGLDYISKIEEWQL